MAAQGGVNFPAHYARASLKLDLADTHRPQAGDFPAHYARASLKLCLVFVQMVQSKLHYFPAHYARASLKRLLWLNLRLCLRIFPRTTRGPH